MYMHSYTALIITFIFNLIKCLISAFFCIISVLLFKCYPSCPTFFKVKVTQLMETLPRSFRSKEDRPLELTQLRGPAHIRVSAPPLRWVGTGQDGSAPDTALARSWVSGRCQKGRCFTHTNTAMSFRSTLLPLPRRALSLPSSCHAT